MSHRKKKGSMQVFQPYYKNQVTKEKKIAKYLKTTDMTYAQIGKVLSCSDHSVTDTNKKFSIRPRRPTMPRLRPTNETWRRNRPYDGIKNKKRRKGLEEVERLRKEGKSPFYTAITTKNKKMQKK